MMATSLLMLLPLITHGADVLPSDVGDYFGFLNRYAEKHSGALSYLSGNWPDREAWSKQGREKMAELLFASGATVIYPPLQGARPARTPFARGYRVLEVLPYREKHLRAALRERGIGRLTVKKRGVDVVPEQLRRRLALRGDAEATIVLTRVAGEGTALLVEPLA